MISLTPLIDVVFIMLLFFMLASNFQQWRQFNLNVPERQPSASGDDDVVVLRLRADGGMEIDGRAIRPRRLESELTLRLDEDRPVVLAPDAEVSLQAIVSVIDRLAAQGLGTLSLAPQTHEAVHR